MNKPISDIRVYTSRLPNADGSPIPESPNRKALAICLRRIAMKLREYGFSLGGFDHLYMNLTPCLPEGEVRLAERSVYSETTLYRYVDAGVTESQLDDICISRKSVIIRPRRNAFPTHLTPLHFPLA